jgi:hypothetical protein
MSPAIILGIIIAIGTSAFGGFVLGDRAWAAK